MTPMRLGRIALCAIIAGLLLAPAARAQDCEAPPGTAAVDQYCESIPSSSRDTPSTSIDRTGAGGGGGNATAASRRLAQSGTGGPELAAFVAQTRPQRAAQEVRGTVSASAPEPAGGFLRAVRFSTGTGDTTGAGFLIAIIAVLAAVGGWWLAQRRSAGRGGGE